MSMRTYQTMYSYRLFKTTLASAYIICHLITTIEVETKFNKKICVILTLEFNINSDKKTLGSLSSTISI